MDIIESLLTCSKDERIQAWKLLNVHPDTLPLFESKVNDLIQIALEKANLVSKNEVKEIVKDELDTSFDNRLITSDLEVLPRIRATEKVTGIYHFEEWEEHEPTIPEQIKELTERLEQPLHKSTASIKLELPFLRPH